MKYLGVIEEAGDPVFVFELRDSKGALLALLPTKASLIKQSLVSGGSLNLVLPLLSTPRAELHDRYLSYALMLYIW